MANEYLLGNTGANWDATVTSKSLDIQCYEESIMWPQVTELERPYGSLAIPRHDRLSVNTLGTTTAGSAITFSSNTETAFTTTHATAYCATAISKQLTARMYADAIAAFKQTTPKSVSAKIDTDLLSLVASLTTNTAGSNLANLDKGVILDAVQQLASGAKEFFRPGKTEGIFIVGVNQVDDVLNISDITSAQFRGDTSNPVVSGWVTRAFGCRFYETGNVSTASSTYWNVLFIPRAFGIGFNHRPNSFTESYLLEDRVVAWADYGYGTVRDEYAVPVKSITT